MVIVWQRNWFVWSIRPLDMHLTSFLPRDVVPAFSLFLLTRVSLFYIIFSTFSGPFFLPLFSPLPQDLVYPFFFTTEGVPLSLTRLTGHFFPRYFFCIFPFQRNGQKHSFVFLHSPPLSRSTTWTCTSFLPNLSGVSPFPQPSRLFPQFFLRHF